MTYVRLANRNNDFFTDQLLDQLIRETRDEFSQKMNTNGTARPLVNIIEKENEFVLEMAIPGFSKEEVNIQLEKDLLKVMASKEEQADELKYRKREFTVSNFEKKFKLSPKIDQEQIAANVENGVLRIQLPLKKEAQPVSKTIAIQ